MLVALLLITATIASVGRSLVADEIEKLNYQFIPAQNAADELTKSYVDQETGQRGFLLTDDSSFLQPYFAGATTSQRLHDQLATLLRGDATGSAALNAVSIAAQRWRDQAARPEIAARQHGPVTQSQIDAMTLTGKDLFDTLRVRLATLQARTTALTSNALATIAATQANARHAPCWKPACEPQPGSHAGDRG